MKFLLFQLEALRKRAKSTETVTGERTVRTKFKFLFMFAVASASGKFSVLDILLAMSLTHD